MCFYNLPSFIQFFLHLRKFSFKISLNNSCLYFLSSLFQEHFFIHMLYHFCLPLISVTLSVIILSSPFLPFAFTQEFHFEALIKISATSILFLAALIIRFVMILLWSSISSLSPTMCLFFLFCSLGMLS